MTFDRIYTLGPEGSCHQNTARAYLDHFGMQAEIRLVPDIFEGAEAVLTDPGPSALIQCSAHLTVHLVTEKFLGRLHVNDTFIFPTQPMALLKRRDVARPRSLGIPEPAMGYITPEDWEEIVFESTKPVVTTNLLAGKYDAGFAYVRDAVNHPETLEICETVGEVVTTWIVYAKAPRFAGKLISTTREDRK